ncbi:helix-turn-helix domain-containing protein [Pantoea sp. AMG 501]|uniref:helix-turn-helix domain-containing protein n=1 Tax=Pantoea sp. AMG 501 TaxID=2008894 RepID=UPI000B5A4234|nr:helix-turn-helix domain-containing protein [Pantoea sp. AMG 501]OWY74562.1 AraC family transcriptional regulator [Pantoea sp. AMG 501]
MLKVKTHSKLVADSYLTINDSLMFVRPRSACCAMTFLFKSCHKNKQYKVSGASVLVSLEPVDAIIKGQWDIEIIMISQLTRLLAFLDYQQALSGKETKLSSESRGGEISQILLKENKSFLALAEDDSLSFIDMLIGSIAKPDNHCIKQLSAFIRNIESYWITYFLLSRFMDVEKKGESFKLSSASSDYGVSETYFRKLCRNAFICGPKKQLRIWRAAQSALQLIEKDISIEMVAIDNSYASSSHFTSEMKSIFGITPGELRKRVGLFHE